MSRPIFRVFLSSTFGDFQAEREKLRAEVWPRLEALCAAHGASFHVVDLRWGISPSVATTHDTIRICLDEIKRCQEISPLPRPNFLMLIGDRYGWRPPAVEITDTDFRSINKAVSKNDADFLLSWYRKNSNAVPTVWCLKPRQGAYAEFAAWNPVENRLTGILHRAAEQLGLAPVHYLYSATHMEIVDGLLKLEGLQNHIFSFNRELNGLPESAVTGIARRFADYLPDGIRDPEAVELLSVLKRQVADVLPIEQINLFRADWLGDESSPISTVHLENLCKNVERSLLSVIEPELKLISATTPLQEELELQRQFLEETGKILIGRDEELKRIQAYLARRKTPLPLIVRATGGAGKSALLAKAVMARLAENGTLIYRFIGAAPRSWQPLTFLQDMIQEIAEAYGQQPPTLPEDGGIRKIAELFHEQLEYATEEHPLTIFIDAIDQFNSTSPVHYSDLFPKQIPANVKMVISVLEGVDSQQLEKLYPKAPLIHLNQLTTAACGRILDALLPERKLTKEQRTSILITAKESGLPLWLTLVAQIARKLSSWDEPPELPGNIKELARYVIRRIGDKHGHVITIASLRYIKLARFGLSETELQELLWADPEVKAEFDNNKNSDQPPVTVLPPVFWSRLYAELDPYINEYWMDGQLLHRYFHRVFGEVADEMDGGTRKTLHGRLAEYFAQQPLYLEPAGTDNNPPEGNDTAVSVEAGLVPARPPARSEAEDQQEMPLLPNGRKLMELPYNLVQAGRINDARTVITRFEFGMAKCRLNRSDDWAEDFRRANRGEKTRDYRIWESFVWSNAHVLRRGNEEWPAHKILLQLAVEHADDSPATIGAEKFLAEGKCDWAWLRRELRVNHAGIDPCLAVFEGHENNVTGAFCLPDEKILSWSYDGTLRIWDQESGVCLKIMEGHTDYIAGALLLFNGRILSWSGDKRLRLWNIDGELLKVMEGHTDSIQNVLLQTNGRLLSWSEDNTLRLWDSNGDPLIVMKGHSDIIKDVLLLPSGYILSYSKDNTIRLWSDEGELIKIMAGHTKAVKGVRLFPDGRLLSWSMDNSLRIWSSDGEPLKVMDWHKDEIDDTLIFPDGRILSWSFKKMHLWSTDGKRLKTLKGHSYGVNGAMILPDDCVLTWAADKTLRIWSSDGAQLSTLRGHTGDIEGVKLLSDGRFLSWCGMDSHDPTLRLWDSDGNLIAVMEGHTFSAKNVHELPSGLLLSWSSHMNDGNLILWDSNGKLLQNLSKHTRMVEGVMNLDDGSFLTWARDKTLRTWDTNGNQKILPDGHKHNVGGFQLLHKGRYLTWDIFHREESVRLWSPDGEPLKKFHLSESNISFFLLPDGRLLSWSDSLNFRLWSSKGHPIKLLQGHTGHIYGVLSLPDGRMLSWSRDNTLCLWSSRGNLLRKMVGHTKIVHGALQLTDGKILSWSADKTLRLWSSVGDPINTLLGHMDGVEGAMLLSDGRILSWSKDKTLRLWNSDGDILKVLVGHTGVICGVLSLTNGRLLSWAGSYRDKDYSPRIWNSDGELLRVLEGHSDELVGILCDGPIVSWSRDKTLRIWNTNGELIKIIDRVGDEVRQLSGGRILLRKNAVRIYNSNGELCNYFQNFEHLILNSGIWKEYNHAESVGLVSYYTKISILALDGQQLVWQAEPICQARQLFDDGRVIVTQSNGQVCLLKTYKGNRRVILEELQQAKLGEN